jgi:allantoinase
VHVVHVASRAALDALAAAPAGARLTAETCPHYLSFAAEEIADGATAFKCAPPIREARERDALVAALVARELALVASDHSPAPPATKALDSGDFGRAWGGIASLELALSATWTAVAKRGATLVHLARWTSGAPANSPASRRAGRDRAGRDADFVAFDDKVTFGVNASRLASATP